MRRISVALSAVLISGAALAGDLGTSITNLDGSAVVDDKGAPINLTVRSICVNSLMAPLGQDEQAKPDSGEEKVRREVLARHVQDKDDKYKLTAEDIVLIKRLVNRNYPSPLVVSQVWRVLEEK